MLYEIVLSDASISRKMSHGLYYIIPTNNYIWHLSPKDLKISVWKGSGPHKSSNGENYSCVKLRLFIHEFACWLQLPCNTFTATTLHGSGSGLSIFSVSNISIPIRLFRVALYTTPNAPRPSSSPYSTCPGRSSHLSNGIISRTERPDLWTDGEIA